MAELSNFQKRGNNSTYNKRIKFIQYMCSLLLALISPILHVNTKQKSKMLENEVGHCGFGYTINIKVSTQLMSSLKDKIIPNGRKKKSTSFQYLFPNN